MSCRAPDEDAESARWAMTSTKNWIAQTAKKAEVTIAHKGYLSVSRYARLVPLGQCDPHTHRLRDEDSFPEALRDCMEASARGGEEARAAEGPVDEGWEAEEEYGGRHEEGEVIEGRGRARLFEVDADRLGVLPHGSADVRVRVAEAEAAALLDGG